MKKGILALLIFALIFIAGCGNLFAQNTGSRGKGISVGFVSGRPPVNQIIEGQEFFVWLDAVNYGREPVNGELCIFDNLHSSFGGIDEKRCEQVFIDGFEDSGGRPLTVKFPAGEGQGYSYTGINNDIDTSITAEIIYSYRAVITPQITLCNDQRYCRLDEAISGAALRGDAFSSPVTVTRINKLLAPKSGGTSVILDIDIGNTGNGEIVGSSIDDVERVQFSIDSPGVGFDCKIDGNIVVLKNGKKTVRCTGDATLEGETLHNPVDIELVYSYRTRVETGLIRIVNA